MNTTVWLHGAIPLEGEHYLTGLIQFAQLDFTKHSHLPLVLLEWLSGHTTLYDFWARSNWNRTVACKPYYDPSMKF